MIKRYGRSPVLRGGAHYGTSSASRVIWNAVQSGDLIVDVYVCQESERLDTLAGQFLGEGRLWWVIAAASGIGWGLQVPPGTRLVIPREISKIAELVG
jgi:hypothetical protein